jgi:hypothetical protein
LRSRLGEDFVRPLIAGNWKLRGTSPQLGGVIGAALALELIQTFLHAYFSGAARRQRRLAKVQTLEIGNIQP